MSKFTQGKWEYDGRLGVICNETRGIATVYEAGNDGVYCKNPTKEGQANARLIAAAPEMYELLGYLLYYVYEANGLCTNSVVKKETAEDIAKVEKLLAWIDGDEDKKEGEE